MKDPYIQGLIGAAVATLVTFLLPETMRWAWLAGLLWMTVGIYLGMALMDHDRQIRTQFLGALPIIVLLLASSLWPILLVVAWLVHPVWDILHHVGVIKTRIHPATVPFCIVFDLILAAVAAAVVWGLL